MSTTTTDRRVGRLDDNALDRLLATARGPMSCVDIARACGCSDTRVSQVLGSALRKIRGNPRLVRMLTQ